MTIPPNAVPGAVPAVSMAMLASKLGLSVATVSRALSDHYRISARTKQQVLTMAEQLNYQPNQMASALRKGQSNLLGVVLPCIGAQSAPAILQGIEEAAGKAGYHIIVCQSNDDVLLERRHIDALLNAQVAGILVAVARSTEEVDHFDKVSSRGVPLLFFDNAPTDRIADSVALDHYSAAFQTTRHLVEQGCQRIAYLAGPPHEANCYQRHQGYLNALASAGLQQDERLCIYSDSRLEDGAQAMAELLALPSQPDGVVGTSQLVLAGALQTLQSRRIAVPQQIALANCGPNDLPFLTEVALTSIDHHSKDLGRKAVSLFLKCAGNHAISKEQVLLRPVLVPRGSSVRSQNLLAEEAA